MCQLFSYGTLRQPEVQQSLFGATVSTVSDELSGFRVDSLAISDPEVIALSGSDSHPVLVRTADSQDVVSGAVLQLTAKQLAAADAYEVADYQRVRVRLASGREAWAYVGSECAEA